MRSLPERASSAFFFSGSLLALLQAQTLHRTVPTARAAANRQTRAGTEATIPSDMTAPATGSLSLPRSARPQAGGVWSTASVADPEDSVPGDLDALGRHVGHGTRGRMFRLGSYAATVKSFVAPRLVTMLVAAALVAIAVSLAV